MGKGKPVVFFDLDGTLLNDKKEVPSSAKKALFTLKEKGVHIVFATGRAPFLFEHIRNKFDVHSYISFNGSYVVVEGELVSDIPLMTEKLLQLEKAAVCNEHAMVFLNHKDARSNRENDPYIQASFSRLQYPYPPVKEEDYLNKTIYQALLFCEPGEEDVYLNKHTHFDYVRWHPFIVDVLPSGGSKAFGVEQVLNYYGTAVEHSYAFGDELNDLEMLQYVGTSVAMGDGNEKIKEIASYVTKPIDKDGIYHGLRHIGLL